jgi:hypothetical protein
MLSREGASLITGAGGDYTTLTGLVFDGAHKKLPDRRGLVHLESVRG